MSAVKRLFFCAVLLVACGGEPTGDSCSDDVLAQACPQPYPGTHGGEFNQPSGAPNMVFATSTMLPDGRVFIAGGFTKVVDGSERYEIGQASSKAYIFDPQSAEVRQVGNDMNMGRGAHAALYIPGRQQVLLVGGIERLYASKATDCFPFSYDRETAGAVGFTYELFDLKNEKFLQWETEEWPHQSSALDHEVPRVFPVVTGVGEDGALVTGGGQWPSCDTDLDTDPDYLAAELYDPTAATPGFQPTLDALTMGTIRVGHNAFSIVDEEELQRIILVGGSSDDVIDVFTPDGGLGVMLHDQAVAGSLPRAPAFAQLTPLYSNKWLLSGGLEWHDDALGAPSNSLHVIQWYAGVLSGSPIATEWEPRVFHTAVSYGDGPVTLLGGLPIDGGFEALSDSALYDPDEETLTFPADDAPAVGGAASAFSPLLECIFLAGGIDGIEESVAFGPDTVAARLQFFCPSHRCPAPADDCD